METSIAVITGCFTDVEDPRIDRRKRHKLIDIIVIAICAVICGADGWVAIEKFGKAKRSWLKRFLELPNGIPSHDTFGRVFARLDPEQFRAAFLRWVRAVFEVTDKQVIAIDGKQLRRSHDKVLGKEAIQMVSAWAEANRLVLGQTKVEESSNEITAIPQLLQILDVAGCLVTIDAIGCQKEIAEMIVDKGGDYLLAVKRNQRQLYEDIVSLFEEARSVAFRHVDHDHYQSVNKGHGRIEIRRCWTITDPIYLDYLRDLKWKKLRTIVKVVGERRIGDKTTVKTRYYISSAEGSAKTFLRAARRHWSIENCHNWVLDVAFQEDNSRVRKGNAAQNLAVLRQIALNLLSQEKTARCGTKTKRLMAAWDESYLLKVLGV